MEAYQRERKKRNKTKAAPTQIPTTTHRWRPKMAVGLERSESNIPSFLLLLFNAIVEKGGLEMGPVLKVGVWKEWGRVRGKIGSCGGMQGWKRICRLKVGFPRVWR